MICCSAKQKIKTKEKYSCLDFCYLFYIPLYGFLGTAISDWSNPIIGWFMWILGWLVPCLIAKAKDFFEYCVAAMEKEWVLIGIPAAILAPVIFCTWMYVWM